MGGLSNDLIAQFVKVTNDNNKSKTESTVYGTTVEYNGATYVKLDGSELLTPIATTADTKPGERVVVMIKNHTATITGNISSPAARTEDVRNLALNAEEIGSKITEFEVAIGDKADVKELNAANARIDTLQSDNVTIKESLTAAEADIDTLTSENVTIKESLTAAEANIDTLVAADVTINEHLSAAVAEIDILSTSKLDAGVASLTYATIGDLDSTNATLHNLDSTFGDFKVLTTNKFDATDASIEALQAGKISAADIEGKYANIDFSNIDEATMEYFYANSGLITDVTVNNGTITGNLVGVTISGDLIEGNTVKAEKLIIKGTDGLYYKLNTDGMKTEAEQTDQNSLNGSIITAKSITASKVSVDDLVAFDATIGGFNITQNAIYSGVKSSAANTTRGLYLDNDGQAVFGDASNFVKYYKDANGKYKLEISADSVIIGNDSVATAISEVSESTQANAADLANYISATNAELDNLQGQIDGSITTWFYEYVPTASNVPASSWTTTELKNNHLGDLFYDTLTGYCYRWQVKNNAYSWTRITDVDVTKALADAATAQATADNKRRVFVSTPTPPYDIGDLWVQGTAGDLMRCKTAKTSSQSYAAADWVKASKYTDDTAANAAQADADALAVRMSSAETTISKNQDEIALRATKTEVTAVANNLANNYYTKSQADSALTVKANEIASTVSSTYATKTALAATDVNVAAAQEAADAAQLSVDNLEIGGRNYMLNTSNEWSNEVSFSGWQAYVLNCAPAGLTDLVGQTITFSGYVRTVSGGNVGMMLHVDTPDKTYGYHQVISLESDAVAEGTEGYISRTATLPADVTNITGIRLALRHHSSTDPDSVAQYRSWKLEKGSKATDWSPAPEDLATGDELDAVATRVTAAETAITQHTDAISLRATKTEVTTAKSEAISAAATDATTKANNAKSQAISTAASDATTKANNAKSEAISTAATDATTKANNALASAKSYADAQIKISADSITSTVNSVKSTAEAAQKQIYHSAQGESGVAGYAAVAQLVVTGNYVNAPILFGLTDRGKQSSNVSLCFNSVNNTDPTLSHIQSDGDMKIWAYKAATSTWELIVQKSEAWDEIYVNDFANPRTGVTVNWINKLYSELPTENITAATVLAAKVTKSTIDNLGTRMTSAETKITQNATSITSVASRTTAAETKISTLEQTADGFTASLATTNSNVTTAQNTANTAKTNAANAAKTATNYLSYSSSGLVVGDMTASSLGKNVLIDSDSVDIRNGTTTLASFGANKVTLGRNASDSKIDLCNGAGTISANTASAATSYPYRNAILIDSQEIETESVRFVSTVSNEYGTTTEPSITRQAQLYMLRSDASDTCSNVRIEAEHMTNSNSTYTSSGFSALTYDAASKTRALMYASDSANKVYNQINAYPSKTTMSKPLYIDGTEFSGKNKVLWSGAWYMSSGHTATLSEAVSSQANGIVLVFSRYSSSTAQNYHFQSFFVSKQEVAAHVGCGHTFMLTTDGNFGSFASKYLYINNTSVAGNDVNKATGTGDCGITYTNNGFVLRYVIGV